MTDFCYCCGRLDHVTRSCSYKEPTIVTTSEGISVKLYDPLLREERTENLWFVNVPKIDREIKKVVDSRRKFDFPSI